MEFQIDFEKLKVYQKALDFIDSIFQLIRKIPQEYKYSIGDNLLRASLSIANNLAEGNDQISLKERHRYFRISSNSARECVSVLIVLDRQKLIDHEFYLSLKFQAREITSMIQGLRR